jgi:aminoglycoside phosphotransferase
VNAPAEGDARAVAAAFAREQIESAVRFATGSSHWVYDVATVSGRRFVVRLGAAGSAHAFEAAVRWSRRLRPLGVPLPALLARGRHDRFPYLVLERLPGVDLGAAYPALDRAAKNVIAARVAHAQAIVGTLPLGAGFGFTGGERGPFPDASWAGVVARELGRARRWIESTGAVDFAIADRVAHGAARFEDYFAGVPPRAFLDDATTKNVIVDGDRLAGIVDVDCVCYGDRLFPIGLTRASLRNLGYEPDYTDAWLALLQPSARERAVVSLYAALFCAMFLGEMGQAFNRVAATPDPERIARLCAILDDELARAEDPAGR